jgi:hypothetical protein
MDFPPGITKEMTPDEAFDVLVEFLNSGPDDDLLCLGALTIGEPLIDWWYSVVLERFIDLLIARPELRKMVSCCDFDSSVPEEVRERLDSFVRPEDNYGGMSLD